MGNALTLGSAYLLGGPLAPQPLPPRCLPDPTVLSLTSGSMCQPRGSLCHRPFQPPALRMTTSMPDTPCSIASPYVQAVSLKPPSPHPKTVRAPPSPEAAVSRPFTPAERGWPAGQPVIREDSQCSHNLFSGNCQGSVVSWKKPGPI